MYVRGVKSGVFLTFIQHCIQRNITHVGGVKSAYRALNTALVVYIELLLTPLT